MVTTLPELLTPREVARALRVSYRTVLRMIERGDIRAVRLGREGASLRVPHAELERITNPNGGTK